MRRFECPVCRRMYSQKWFARHVDIERKTCTRHEKYYREELRRLLSQFESNKLISEFQSELFSSERTTLLFRKEFGDLAFKKRKNRILSLRDRDPNVVSRRVTSFKRAIANRSVERQIEVSKSYSQAQRNPFVVAARVATLKETVDSRSVQRKLEISKICSETQVRFKKKFIEAQNRPEVALAKSIATIRNNKRLVAEGKHNWPNERPCNNPTERVLDLALISIFLADTNHNFKIENQDGREFQLDFVSWLLRFNVEADEPDHKAPKRKAWDDERDQYIEDSKELDFVYRYSTEYAITNLVDVIKKICELVNQQREKYRLHHLTILKFDDRWTTYYEQMQELLKEWFYSKEGARRFKIFRNKKREIDKQWFWLLEEECKEYDSNFAAVYREILEKNLKLNFKNVISSFRKKGVINVTTN